MGYPSSAKHIIFNGCASTLAYNVLHTIVALLENSDQSLGCLIQTLCKAKEVWLLLKHLKCSSV